MTCHFIVYNVKLGQCIAVLPHTQREYAMMVDCGHDRDFHPIDDFSKYLPKDSDNVRPSLRSLVITNYDHDHFSGLPNLHDTTKIESVVFPKNLSMKDIRALKSESTTALDTLDVIRRTYTADVTDYAPPFTRVVFSLEQEELSKAGVPIATNHLSQVVFVEYGETVFCIPGDIENRSWELMLSKPDVQFWLRKTNILIAPHHGRENGYHEEIFTYCTPYCVIMSDNRMMHGTQIGMSSLYASHVHGNGITYAPASGTKKARKTLTTRNDGHILISAPLTGVATFKAYVIT